MLEANDRRVATRSPVRMFFNKYIDGTPHLSEALELSMSGLLARRVGEPDAERACFALELAPPEGCEPKGRLWLCARPVWRVGGFEALAFILSSPLDRLRLSDLLQQSRAAS